MGHANESVSTFDSVPGRAGADVPTAAVEVVRLSKRYDDVEAVSDVSFSVAPGEVFAFLGPNGAGKSTAIKMLCTLARPTSGSARVAGYDVVRQPRAVRRRIGLVFQEQTLDQQLSAEENLRFHAVLYHVPEELVASRIDRVLELVALEERRGDLVSTFSGGMARRLEIARGMLHTPTVIFLDEPAEYADRIAIIDRGRLVALDTPANLKAIVGADSVELETADDEAAGRALREVGLDARRTTGGIRVFVDDGEAQVARLIGVAGVPVRKVHVHRPTLDDVFLHFTGREIREGGPGSPSSVTRAWGGRRA